MNLNSELLGYHRNFRKLVSSAKVKTTFFVATRPMTSFSTSTTIFTWVLLADLRRDAAVEAIFRKFMSLGCKDTEIVRRPDCIPLYLVRWNS